MKSIHPSLRKKMEPFERSTLKLMSIFSANEDKETINFFPYTTKTHSMLKERTFIYLYAEDIHFLIKRTEWLVARIYEHYLFEQSKFRKDFLVMNQIARQQAPSSVEKDFYKLLNDSKFGIDCRNNIDNCIMELFYDDIDFVHDIDYPNFVH